MKASTLNDALMDMPLHDSNTKLRIATKADLKASIARLKEDAVQMEREARHLRALLS